MGRGSPWGPRFPTTPRLALSLRRLGNEVDARWPTRQRHTDGWIGDSEHKTRVSDHNPDPRGLVHAIDLTTDGLDVVALLAAVPVYPSVHYVIHDGKIWSRANNMRPTRYDGINPHREHMHVSIFTNPRAERSRHHWFARPAHPGRL